MFRLFPCICSKDPILIFLEWVDLLPLCKTPSSSSGSGESAFSLFLCEWLYACVFQHGYLKKTLWFRHCCHFRHWLSVCSSMFFLNGFCLFVCFSLMIYYRSVLSGAHKSMSDMYREQLVMVSDAFHVYISALPLVVIKLTVHDDFCLTGAKVVTISTWWERWLFTLLFDRIRVVTISTW